jgi:hypothetical protein
MKGFEILLSDYYPQIMTILAMNSMTLPRAWIALSLVAFAVLLWRLSRIGRRPSNYPPGPPTLPLIGNLHQMPSGNAHLQFQKWAETYGPVYSLMLGTKVAIVVSSDSAVKDLLDKRSSIYSGRPEMYMGQNIMSGSLRPLFMVLSFNQRNKTRGLRLMKLRGTLLTGVQLGNLLTAFSTFPSLGATCHIKTSRPRLC